MGVADDPLKDEDISGESKDGPNLRPMPEIFRQYAFVSHADS